MGQELAPSIHQWFLFSICGIPPFISMHSLAASRLTTTSGCVGLCLPFFQMTNDKHSLIASDDSFHTCHKALIHMNWNSCLKIKFFSWPKLISLEFQFIPFSFQPGMIQLKLNVPQPKVSGLSPIRLSGSGRSCVLSVNVFVLLVDYCSREPATQRCIHQRPSGGVRQHLSYALQLPA